MDTTDDAERQPGRAPGGLVMQWRVDGNGSLTCRWVPEESLETVVELRPAAPGPAPAGWTLAS